jgi:ABC-type multidrug transport system ATPase subunit
MKEETRNGKTYVFSIHQPISSVYEMFDYLILLSKGKLIYFGKSNEVESYFKNMGSF